MRKITFILLCICLLSACQETEKVSLVKIRTKFGVIKMVLHDETPVHKANFLKHIREGKFDSLLFHRTIQGFMIQGGDPDSKHAVAGQALGDGDVGYTLPAEFNEHLFHQRGAVGAARDDNPEKRSSGIQFYIVQGRKISVEELTTDMKKLRQGIVDLSHKPGFDSLEMQLQQVRKSAGYIVYRNKIMELKQLVEKELQINLTTQASQEKIDAYTRFGGTPHLDNDYTVFGQVVDGMDVVDRVAAQTTDSLDRPLSDLRFFVEVEEMDKAEIEQLYHYQFSKKPNQ
ncbi:MAG: peptidylprolyl isomerase [Bacteroidales bacterium]|nr:peptidylprolyl isomerase [Bacteroidales bacterium]